MEILVAFPSDAPGGLDAPLSEHFGHCGAFTVVRLRDGKVSDVQVLPATAHAEGGCLAVVERLAAQGVRAVVATGMGGRPLAGLLQAGIAVYRAAPGHSVRACAEALAREQLAEFGADFVCGSGHAGSEGTASCA